MTTQSTTLLADALDRLANRNSGRSEGDIQSDIKLVLVSGAFDLGDQQVSLEAPATDQHRLDIEVGALVIECKRDLRADRVLRNGEIQLEGYLSDRQSINGGTYVGILTDGATWRCYRRTADVQLELVSNFEHRGSADERKFRWWLGALLATERQLKPTSDSIRERLGSDSPGCQLALKELGELWARSADLPELRLKRALWGRLLRTALGTQFEGSDELFVSHTYLVLVASLIAHAVIGFPLEEIGESPAVALSGQLFARSEVRGVGEAGFFDWVLDVDGGASIVSDIARRLAVFEWSGVNHDVLKALYHSVIDQDTRHRLGEYYTPDWLAKRIVEAVVDNPLSSRVLDPGCGSGTFLFHAVQRYLEAAQDATIPLSEAVGSVVDHVYGMDLHPVAVVLAQVTYLLAIGTERFREAGTSLSIPVYLGDSMRWELSDEALVLGSGDVVVSTDESESTAEHEEQTFAFIAPEELRFPASVVSDPGRFDRLVDELATRASSRKRGDKPLSIDGIFRRFAVSETDRSTLEKTYRRLCELHDQERDHIWGFYVRNQARPAWFADRTNRVDVLVGNPPWLAYRFMPVGMKTIYERRARERHLWAGGAKGRSTQQDLCSYFVVRSIELYLNVYGRFGFVMPLAALSRQTYVGFRGAMFSTFSDSCSVAFDVPWDLDAVDPDPFPVPSSVVLGSRTATPELGDRVPMPANRLVVAGDIGKDGSMDRLSWTLVNHDPEEFDSVIARSPYARRFRQGAILVPRMLALVETDSPGPLQKTTQTAVHSRRGRLDKAPWKDLPSHSGVIESIFVKDAYLGEHCLPFRMFPPVKSVVPFDGTTILTSDDKRIERYPGFEAWWRGAEDIWNANRRSELRTLGEQLDYIHQLSAQFPLAPLRVVYTKSGNTLASAMVTNASAVIDHMLYWCTVSSQEEGRYLTAMLNSPVLGELVAPLQSRGAFGARHFDKYIWQTPIPEYEPTNPYHQILVAAAERNELIAGSVNVEGVGFQRARALIRTALDKEGARSDVDDALRHILASEDVR